MSNDPSFLPYLACPRCGQGPVEAVGKEWRCGACALQVPSMAGIPWLYANPGAALADWKARYDYFLAILTQDTAELKLALRDNSLLKTTEDRLRRLLQAKTEHMKELAKLLAPLNVKEDASAGMHQGIGTKLPESQSLMSYYANALRDWGWGDEENRISAQLVASIAGASYRGVVGVLGAGASRLAIDLHQQCKPQSTIAVDINPFLMLLAAKVVQGRAVTLYDFPIAPLSKDVCGVKVRCNWDGALANGFHFLFADALQPLFKEQSLDVALTPWFIDIIPEDSRVFFRRVNAMLKVGGSWINFGTLAYGHHDQTLCYGRDELAGIAAEAGFRVEALEEHEIPYMQSPYSAQRRRENVLVFRFIKEKHLAAPPPYRLEPAWIANPELPAPALASLRNLVVANRVFADLAELADGSRSIRAIGQAIAPRLGCSEEEATFIAQRFFMNHYEAGLRGTQF